MSLVTEFLVGLIICLALLVGGFIGGYNFRGDREAVQAVKIEDKQNAQHEKDTVAVEDAGSIFAADTAKPLTQPAPVISVCPAPARPMRAPAPARPAPDAAPADGGANKEEPTVVRWDSAPVVIAGRNADLQIKGLQDYITNVCRPK